MEVEHGGARTRAVEEVTSLVPCKRRKVDSEELMHSSASSVQLLSHCCYVASPGNSVSPANSGTSDHVLAFSGLSKHSCEITKRILNTSDLKNEDFGADFSVIINDRFSQETTPTSKIYGDSGGMDSSISKKHSPANSLRKPSPATMPSAAEIDEFFCKAEKYERKRFAEKYNYDIEKDVPLEDGRYQWVRLKP